MARYSNKDRKTPKAKLFHQRRKGLFKKAYEIHKYCGAKVVLLVNFNDIHFLFRSEENWPPATKTIVSLNFYTVGYKLY